MIIEEALYTYLSTYPDLASLIGDKIYPFLLPEKTVLPAVIFYGVGEQNFYTFEGPRPNYNVEMEFLSFGQSYFDAKAVIRQLKKALHNCPGAIASVYKVEVQGIPDEYYHDVKFYQSGLRVTISATE